MFPLKQARKQVTTNKNSEHDVDDFVQIGAIQERIFYQKKYYTIQEALSSLRTKLGAFANLNFRDALFPRAEYRSAWDALVAALSTREASRTIVGLLWLAHTHACETDLAVALDQTLQTGDLPDLDAMRERFECKEHMDHPDIPVLIPAAAVYDDLLSHREVVA